MGITFVWREMTLFLYKVFAFEIGTTAALGLFVNATPTSCLLNNQFAERGAEPLTRVAHALKPVRQKNRFNIKT